MDGLLVHCRDYRRCLPDRYLLLLENQDGPGATHRYLRDTVTADVVTMLQCNASGDGKIITPRHFAIQPIRGLSAVQFEPACVQPFGEIVDFRLF